MFRIFSLYTLIMLSINLLDTRDQHQHHMKTFDTSHEGQRVKVSLDDTLKIILPTQMGTGYRWMWEAQGAFRLLEEKVEAKANRPGAAEEQVFIIRPLQKGQHQLHLSYQRSWEKQLLKDYTLQVEVAE
jgi:predicted secreted protein